MDGGIVLLVARAQTDSVRSGTGVKQRNLGLGVPADLAAPLELSAGRNLCEPAAGCSG